MNVARALARWAVVLLLAVVFPAVADEKASRGAAYAAAIADAQLTVCAYPYGSAPRAVRANSKGNPVFGYLGAYECQANSESGYNWYERSIVMTWPAGSTCTSMPNAENQFVLGSTDMCQGSCLYQQNSSGGVDVCLGSGATMYCSAKTWTPTGAACTTDSVLKPHDATKSVCQSTGAAFKECVKPDGSHCVTGAKGSVLCWQPGETGQRAVEDGSLAADRQKAPTTPAISTSITSPTTVGTTTTTINHTTYNTVTATGTGNTGGQGNTGTGGRTGNGTGTSDGTGQGTGDGEGEGSDDDGNAGPGLGDLYEASDDTAESVLSGFYDEVSATPIVESVTGFMQVSGSGSCPAFNVPATAYWQAMTYSAHCEGAFLAFLQAMGWVIFAMASYVAVKIAIT